MHVKANIIVSYWCRLIIAAGIVWLNTVVKYRKIKLKLICLYAMKVGHLFK